MGWGIIFMLLAFPASLSVYAFGPLLGRLPFSDIVSTLFFMSAGYFQWFVALPWVVKNYKKKQPEERNENT